MLNHAKLKDFETAFDVDANNSVLANIISANPLSKLSGVVQENQQYNPVYNVSVKPHLKVTNQKSSGRCWLFAALNVVRREICLKYNLSDFEFSQVIYFFGIN